MNFIKKAIKGEVDESVHIQFQKFSKGEFRNRAIFKIKSSAGKYSISTSAEFANDLVRTMAEKLGENKTNITGAIVSTADLKGKIEFKEIKQFQGVKRYLIDKEMSGKEVLSLLNEFPKNFFALTFDAGENKLKIKPKAPKSGKPGSKGDEMPKPDFCSLKTNDSKIAGDFLFESQGFKEAEVFHTFLIEQIVIPDELKNSKDFAIIREAARRKGKIIRKSRIDGKDSEKEYPFEA